jgi:hypothetical protein
VSGTSTPRLGLILTVGLVVSLLLAAMSAALFITLFITPAVAACGPASPSVPGAIVLGPGGNGQVVGATEYGGPGDPSSGTVGASGVRLLAHPDSYAELGGATFATATAMGGLPYMTPLRITWGTRTAIAYKRDIGRGGGPIDGRPRVIDLWWQLAVSLGIPYDHGSWSGLVRIARSPQTGAANLLGAVPSVEQSAPGAGANGPAASPDIGGSCAPDVGIGVPLSPGQTAVLLPDGRAAAPAGAPAAVKGVIAAGNEIVGVPYVFGAAHGLPLSELAPAYDCSSSVEHLLHGGGLLPASYDSSSSGLEAFGAPGPGRWITLYANATHVFMYVAGLRWDTWDAAGARDGSSGIGWHPLVRDAAGFVARHPVGL